MDLKCSFIFVLFIPQIYFTIGSVDTFERNLENAQLELQMDAAHYVPVLYRSQMELSNVMSSLPTLLLLGFLIWSFRRTGRMMGGMGGGGRGGGGRGPFGGGAQGEVVPIIITLFILPR